MATVQIDGTDHEVYIDEAAADAYLQADASRRTAWAALATDTKLIYIVSATRRLDRLKWKGTKSVAGQALEWPRDNVGVEWVDDGVVPQAILDATAVLAGDLALDESVADQLDAGANIRSVKAGTAQVQFFRPTFGPKLAGPLIELVGDLLKGGVNDGGLAVGTDGESSFGSLYPYGRRSGFP